MKIPLAKALMWLLPVVGMAQTTMIRPSFPAHDPQNSIVDNAESSSNHQTLAAAMRATELDEILDRQGPFTVFAPSDIAFKRLSRGEMSDLLEPGNKEKLQRLLRYHIVAGNITASRILRALCRGEGTATFTTVQGEDIAFSMDGIDIVLTDSQGNKAKILAADYAQCNGVIHAIDSVMMPPELNWALNEE
ncbi:MAG: fasciclin domain-containing protein [Flavobacteriaceae bacterium]